MRHINTQRARRPVRAFFRPAASVLARAYLGLLTSLLTWALLPLIMGWVPTVVISGSMEPLIMTGDLIAAQRITPTEISAGAVHKGQVLLTVDPLKPSAMITHRVTQIQQDGTYTTKGDANTGADPVNTKPGQIIGIERYRVPYIGIPIAAAKNGNPAPLLVFVAVTTASLMIVRKDRLANPKSRTKGRRASRKRRVPRSGGASSGSAGEVVDPSAQEPDAQPAAHMGVTI